MGWLDDVGDFGKDLWRGTKDVFTGDWSDVGSDFSAVGGDIKDNPWVLAAPAAIAGGAALGAGALGAFGVAEGAGALGAVEAGSEFVGPTLAQAGLTDIGAGGGLALDPWAAASPEALGGFASVETPGQYVGSEFDALAMGQTPGGQAISTPMGGNAPMNLLGGGPGAGGGGGTPGWLDTLTSPNKWTLGGVAQGAGVVTAGGLLGKSMLGGQGLSANQQGVANITSSAVQQAQYDTAAGRELQAYLRNGTLPAGMQAQVDRARKSARAAAISNAAKNGQSTNPQNNTQLQQSFEDADRQALILATQMETNLFQQGTAMVDAGLRATGLSMEGYKALAGFDKDREDAIGKALVAMAGAFGGRSTMSGQRVG